MLLLITIPLLALGNILITFYAKLFRHALSITSCLAAIINPVTIDPDGGDNNFHGSNKRNAVIP
eukprot:899350-Rhodomonas_salina.1